MVMTVIRGFIGNLPFFFSFVFIGHYVHWTSPAKMEYHTWLTHPLVSGLFSGGEQHDIAIGIIDHPEVDANGGDKRCSVALIPEACEFVVLRVYCGPLLEGELKYE